MPSSLVDECLCLAALSHGPIYRLCERYVAKDHCCERTSFPLPWNSCRTPGFRRGEERERGTSGRCSPSPANPCSARMALLLHMPVLEQCRLTLWRQAGLRALSAREARCWSRWLLLGCPLPGLRNGVGQRAERETGPLGFADIDGEEPAGLWRHPQGQFRPRVHIVLKEKRFWDPGKTHLPIQGLPTRFEELPHGQPRVRPGHIKGTCCAFLCHLDDPCGRITGIDAL